MKSQNVLIALGGNLGDVPHTMKLSIAAMGAHPQFEVTETSRLYSTQPVGIDAGDVFYNAVIQASTTQEPVELLDLLQETENQLGRVRTIHWGPRAIDLDLILFGEQKIDTPRLRVPHPCCFYRRFVLDPALEIAASWVHPDFKLTLSQLQTRLQTSPFRFCVIGDDPLRAELMNVQEEGQPFQCVDSPDEAILTFDCTSQLRFPSAIHVPPEGDRKEFVQQILIAATDSPVPVGSL